MKATFKDSNVNSVFVLGPFFSIIICPKGVNDVLLIEWQGRKVGNIDKWVLGWVLFPRSGSPS